MWHQSSAHLQTLQDRTKKGKMAGMDIARRLNDRCFVPIGYIYFPCVLALKCESFRIVHIAVYTRYIGIIDVAKQLVRLPSKAYIYSSVCSLCTLIGCQLGWTSPLYYIFGKNITDWVSTYLVVTVNARARPRLTDSAALKRNMCCHYYVIN